MAIRLITDECEIFIPSKDLTSLIKQKSYIVPVPDGKSLVVGFFKHSLDREREISPIALSAIEYGVGVVYVCDRLPKNRVISPNIVYVVVQWRWLIHTLFFNPVLFKGVFGNSFTKKTVGAFSVFTQYKIPIIESGEQFKGYVQEVQDCSNTVLLEIEGGVGDALMCIPTIKTLASQGKRVLILCNKGRVDCFKNLPYVAGIINKRADVDVSKLDRIYWLNFGQILNDYRQELNKKNRIYSIAEVAGLTVGDLVTDRPEIIFSPEELERAEKSWGVYPKRVFFGFDSNRADAVIPAEIVQGVINRLKANGYTVFISSLRKYDFSNCINLCGALSLRDYFGLINKMDRVLTIDSASLHVAGALGKPTLCLMQYFLPEWRCGTYSTVMVHTPDVSCFPCVSKQFKSQNEWRCKNKSCYSFFDWDKVFQDFIGVSERFVFSGERQEDRILVKDLDGLGDILMLTPAIRELHKIYGKVDVLTRFPDAVKNLDFIDKVLPQNLSFVNSSKYIKVFNISYQLSQYDKSFCKQHRILSSAEFLGVKISGEVRPIINLLPDEDGLYQKFVASKRYVVLGLESVDRMRSYPEELYEDLLRFLYGLDLGVEFVVLGRGGVKISRGEDLRGKTSVRELFSIVKHSSACLCVDSAFLHIAGAFKVPNVFLPSGVNADWRKYPESIVINPNKPCYPCNEGGRVCFSGAGAVSCCSTVGLVKIEDALRVILNSTK